MAVAPDSDLGLWLLALIGPAAILFIVTALGLTINAGSLRDDFRRQRSLEHDGPASGRA